LLLSIVFSFCRAKSAEAGKKSPPAPQRGNRAFAGFNPTADDFNAVSEKPAAAAGCALLIPGSGKPNQVNFKQACGSGSGLDPDSVTLWIRIRIGNPDPDPD
jgi:hypothetical protein